MARHHGHPLGPRAGLPPEAATPLMIVGLIWGAAACVGLVWVGGAVARWLAGRGWKVAPLEAETLIGTNLARSFGAPLWLLITVWAVMTVIVIAAITIVMAKRAGRPSSDDPMRSMATTSDMARLTPDGVRDAARDLRPSLAGAKNPPAGECGITLGRLLPKGPVLQSTWEDVVLAIMAPRAGKTTALAVPMVLDAPGAVVATSNKSDLLATTAAARSKHGQVWVFDPQGIAVFPQRFWWNPLAGVRTVPDANRLAKQFVQEVRSAASQSDFWVSAAEDLLTSLILAAAVSGRSMATVYDWLNDSGRSAPRNELTKHGFTAVATALSGRQSGAVETREGIYETARTAAQCLRDPQIMAWITPPATDTDCPLFDPDAFAAGSDTLYLLSKEGGGSAAPLVAAFVDRVIRAGTKRAEQAAGRMDPPLLLCLDECANIVKISDLPDLYSHLGSRGIIPVTILQSAEQGERVWGHEGFATLWSAATVKMIGAGIDSAKMAEDISKLIGDHDVVVRSTSHGRDSSTSTSLRQQRIIPPDRVRSLPKGHALVLATGVRVALVQGLPWYESARADQVARDLAAAHAAIRRRARATHTQAGADVEVEAAATVDLTDPTATVDTPADGTTTSAGHP